MMTRRNHQRGSSLVELLVAMTISLLVLAGVVNSFLASREANRMNDELGFIQENARYALDMLSRDIRQAGDFGCTASAFGSSTSNNYVSSRLVSAIAIQSPVPPEAILYKRTGIEGFDHSASGSFPSLLSGSTDIAADAVIVRRADTDDSKRRFIVSSHTSTATSGAFTIKGSQSLEPGTYMVATDANCQHQALFRMTGPATGTNSTIEYGATMTPAPGNCTGRLRGERAASPTSFYKGDCSDATSWPKPVSGSDYSYLLGSSIMPLKSTMYFIAKSSQDPTTNSLWVRSLGSKGVVPAKEELADGVVDMRITYAVNVNPSVSNTDIPSIVYTTANNIVADEPNTATLPPASLLVWNRVVAVRIQLLMRSRTPVLPSAQAHDYSSIFGAAYEDLNDRFLYQVVSTTVAVRNVFRG
jgi:type IV pilus assembly protein PilW